MSTPGQKPEIAAKGGLLRTIPDSYADIAVTTGNATADLSTYAGLWVWLEAVGADVTIRRFSGAAPTLVAGTGFVIAAGVAEEFFIDPGGALSLRHIGSAAGTLRVHYDAEQAGL